MEFCYFPFTSMVCGLETFATCCPAWVEPAHIARDGRDIISPWDAWNHAAFTALREKLLAGDMSSCEKCQLRMAARPTFGGESWLEPVMRQPPRAVHISNNKTCNLWCGSCRQKKETHAPRRSGIIDWILDGFHEGVTELGLSGNGDPLATPEHLAFLQSDRRPGPDVILRTNGLLLPRHWPTIRQKIARISQSIDAATPETYRKLRRGGGWSDLRSSMALIAELRSTGQISRYACNFLVQAGNFREMGDFVDLCLAHHADQVRFTLIQHWASIPKDTYNKASLLTEGHPDLDDFMRALDDPRLGHPKVQASFIGKDARDLMRRISSDATCDCRTAGAGKGSIMEALSRGFRVLGKYLGRLGPH